MVQTTKAYKFSRKQTLKAYKNNMATNTPNIVYLKKKKKHLKYINLNQSITAKQNQEFIKTIENYK